MGNKVLCTGKLERARYRTVWLLRFLCSAGDFAGILPCLDELNGAG